MIRKGLFGLIACAALATASAGAEPVVEALERPAVNSAHAEHAVLLDAAQAGNRLVVVGERGIVLVSDDAGVSWQQKTAPVSVTLTAVRFADERNGFAVGHGGTVLTTNDGGESWTRRLDGHRAAQLALEAAQASGDARAVRDAELLVADGPDKPLLDLLVFSPQDAVVVGAYGLAFATSDGGQTWRSWMDRFVNPGGMHLYAIRRRGERILVVGEQGLIRLSEDRGRSFAKIDTPYIGSFFTAELPADGSLVIAGLRGNLWRSVDDGANWIQVEVPIPATITASGLAQDGSLILANNAGFILGERQGRLQPLNPSPLPPVNDLLLKPDGTLLALGVQGVMSLPNGEQK